MYGLYGLKHHTVEMSLMRDGQTTNERTREDSATQPLDAGRLRFALLNQIFTVVFTIHKIQQIVKLNLHSDVHYPKKKL